MKDPRDRLPPSRKPTSRSRPKPPGPPGQRPARKKPAPAARARQPAARASLNLPRGVAPLPAPPWFEPRAAEFGVTFDPGDIERLGRYLALLLAANEQMNLTAVRDAEPAWERHLLDAVTLLPILAEAAPEDPAQPLRVIDVGTGGGVPGVPLAVCMPAARFTLMDATEKKCAFLDHVASELGLANLRVVCARAEEAGHFRGDKVNTAGVSHRENALRESFDVGVARAVGRLATLVELVSPFVRIGGLCALTKGEKADEELAEAKQALHLLHLAHAGTVETPTGRVVVLEKLRSTPKAYPRGDGEPKRSPLGVEKPNPDRSDPEKPRTRRPNAGA